VTAKGIFGIALVVVAAILMIDSATPYVVSSGGAGGGCPLGVTLTAVTMYAGTLTVAGQVCLTSGYPAAGTPLYLWITNPQGVTVLSQQITVQPYGQIIAYIPFTQTGIFTLYVSLCQQSASASCPYTIASNNFTVATYPVGTTTVTQIQTQTITSTINCPPGYYNGGNGVCLQNPSPPPNSFLSQLLGINPTVEFIGGIVILAIGVVSLGSDKKLLEVRS
jgi:hypothetical protein